MEDKCVCCGETVPEGTMVCPTCSDDPHHITKQEKTVYYVTSDVHGFFTKMKNALRDAGFFKETKPKKLIVCGDMMDRGDEAVEMEKFMCDLLDKGELIFVRGNHEDLMMEFIDEYDAWGNYVPSHHIHNGTLDTAIQLTNMGYWKNGSVLHDYPLADYMRKTPFVKKLIPASVDYYETPNYIFTHGWLPGWFKTDRIRSDWRTAPRSEWDTARWENGMEHALRGDILPDKTIVCGHYHTSWGRHAQNHYEVEFGEGADFSPFYAKGIIALDACTALSGKVNVIRIED